VEARVIYDVESEDGALRVEVRRDADGRLVVRVGDGALQPVDASQLGPTEWRLDLGDGARIFGVSLDRDRAHVVRAGHPFGFTLTDARKAALRMGDHAAAGEVHTQMPGVVVRVLAQPGDSVKKGQALVVVEAMKMENELKAPIDGVVEAVPVKAGQPVDSGALLVLVKAPS
jgi:biotin carboxyl carrier protein